MNKKILQILPLLWLSVAGAEEIDGRLNWSERVTMSTLVSGVVDKVNVVAGQQVKKGDVLLSLDQQTFRANLASAESAAKSSELAMQEAQKEWERAQELYERTVLSDHELASAKVLFVAAQANHRKAMAEYETAKYELQQSEIRAPFDGVVVSVDAVAGQTVIHNLQSTSMIVMANNQEMIAEAGVSAKQAKGLNRQSAITVKMGGTNYKGKLKSLAVEPQDGLYQLKVSFNSKGQSYRKGEIVEIVLP